MFTAVVRSQVTVWKNVVLFVQRVIHNIVMI